jgi:hypothetical protein
MVAAEQRAFRATDVRLVDHRPLGMQRLFSSVVGPRPMPSHAAIRAM